MKLRSSLRLQQLLFVIGFCVLGIFSKNAWAQQEADITLKSDPQHPFKAKVASVTGTSVMVLDQFGQRGIQIAQIQNIRMAEPPDVRIALTAFQAKDYAKAMAAAKAVADKYKGLPASWAISTSSLIGDIYLEQGDLAKAATAYDDFAKAYPGNTSADLGRARIAVAKKDFDAAKRTAEPLCEQALKKTNVLQAEGQIYGQAFLVMGQVKEAQGDYEGALEEYLRTVTLFYHDPTATALAQERADALRKGRDAFVP